MPPPAGWKDEQLSLTEAGLPAGAALGPLRRPLTGGLLRDFCAGGPGFGKTDRDGLLAACHLLSATAAPQLALMHLVHLALYLLAGAFAVLAARALL